MDIERTAAALKKNGYAVSMFGTAEEGAEYLKRELRGVTIGFGDSATLLAMGLFEQLSAENTVIDPQHCTAGRSFSETAVECLTTDIFITSVNALSEKGELVNIDGMGNRVAGSLYGHKKVYFVAGSNKIEKSLESAVWRARNIAAPRNAQRLGLSTPCAVKGDRCCNCSGPQRICNGLMIYLKKMEEMEMEVVLIDQELGF